MANIIEIKDLEDKRLEVFAQNKEVQLLHYFEPDLGLFIAESTRVIERALDAGYEPRSILVEKGKIDEYSQQIIDRCGDIPVYTATDEVLREALGFGLIRGMLCEMRRRELPTVEEICKNARRIAILEDVENPTNVGAIFRSAAALEMDAVILTKTSADPLYRRSIRVSMGNVFLVPWTIISKMEKWPEEGLKRIQDMGFKVAAMALKDDTISIDDPRLEAAEKLAIVLGTEGEGLIDKTIEMSDYTVKIPMREGVDSLNVAAASAVAFWQLTR